MKMTSKEIKQISNTRSISFSFYVNNRGGGRIRLKDNYFGKKLIIRSNSIYNRTVHTAIDYLANELGFKIQSVTINPDESGVVFMSDWQPEIQLERK
jgi:hypothetical protein